VGELQRQPPARAKKQRACALVVARGHPKKEAAGGPKLEVEEKKTQNQQGCHKSWVLAMALASYSAQLVTSLASNDRVHCANRGCLRGIDNGASICNLFPPYKAHEER
jgi:hypothetical protein